ncbi:MAG: hypothetical protein ABSG15_08530 [FCB group bacterium]
MKSLFKISILLLILFSTSAQALEKVPYQLLTQMSIKTGVYYDEIDEMNQFLRNYGFPVIDRANVFYMGFNYAANHIPFLIYPLPNIVISTDFRFPFARQVQKESTVSLNSYSCFLEAMGFHDIINNITIYPIIGLGISWTNLDIKGNYVELDSPGVFNAGKYGYRFSKFNALFNLGGGADYRLTLSEDYRKKVSMLFGLNVRYSLSLDVFGMYNKSWTSNGQSVPLPSYHAPGLSIELKIGIEYMQRITDK